MEKERERARKTERARVRERARDRERLATALLDPPGVLLEVVCGERERERACVKDGERAREKD